MKFIFCSDGKCQLCPVCIGESRMRLIQRAQERDAVVLRLLFIVVLCAAAMFSLTARAQPPVALEHDGQPGVWFPLPEARLVLQHEMERVDLLERVRLTSEALDLAGAEIRILRSSVAVTDALRESLARAREQAREARAWYRDPLLWGGVGFVAGTVLVTILALAVGGAL